MDLFRLPDTWLDAVVVTCTVVVGAGASVVGPAAAAVVWVAVAWSVGAGVGPKDERFIN